MVGAPYRYSGNTPRGFDCSSLVHYSFARAKVSVPGTARQQRRHSRPLSCKSVRPGNLLFFTQSGKRSPHVGLYFGDERFVHARPTGKHQTVASSHESRVRRVSTQTTAGAVTRVIVTSRTNDAATSGSNQETERSLEHGVKRRTASRERTTTHIVRVLGG
ncbi:MAG: C40 family peptidase [Acidiferrobacterales bacterium]